MEISPIVLIIAVLLVVGFVVWVLRSRPRNTPAGEHFDTSVTAVGAATEAARNVVEEVAETIEHSLEAAVEAGGARPEDVEAIVRNAAMPPVTKSSAVKSPVVTGIGIPAAVGEPDNLRLIKGLGPKLNSLLVELGITRYDQIAAWGDAEIAKVDAHLGTFKGRIVRDNWIEQARLLANGDTAGFEEKFGKLDKPGQA